MQAPEIVVSVLERKGGEGGLGVQTGLEGADGGDEGSSFDIAVLSRSTGQQDNSVNATRVTRG